MTTGELRELKTQGEGESSTVGKAVKLSEQISKHGLTPEEVNRLMRMINGMGEHASTVLRLGINLALRDCMGETGLPKAKKQVLYWT